MHPFDSCISFTKFSNCELFIGPSAFDRRLLENTDGANECSHSLEQAAESSAALRSLILKLLDNDDKLARRFNEALLRGASVGILAAIIITCIHVPLVQDVFCDLNCSRQ